MVALEVGLATESEDLVFATLISDTARSAQAAAVLLAPYGRSLQRKILFPHTTRSTKRPSSKKTS